jgi:hypothetical protein
MELDEEKSVWEDGRQLRVAADGPDGGSYFAKVVRITKGKKLRFWVSPGKGKGRDLATLRIRLNPDEREGFTVEHETSAVPAQAVSF